MIIDIHDSEWIVRFKGKNITFRSYRTFSRLVERLQHAGEATIQFELGGIQEIDAAALGMFLQLFHALDPAHHRIKVLNASPAIQRKLDGLLRVVDGEQDLDAIVSSHPARPEQVFGKVISARSRKIHREESRAEAQTATTDDPTRHKGRMVSYLQKATKRPTPGTA